MSESGQARSNFSNGGDDRAVQALKVPPHSVEAEQSVLGGLLLDNGSWDWVADKVGAHDFYRPEHGMIFEAIGKLINSNQPADVLTVHEELKATGIADEYGITYLNQLASNTPSTANIRGYAEIINDRSILRRLIQVADNIANSAFVPEGKSVRTLLDEAESRILQIGQEGSRKADYLEIEELMKEAIARISELYERESTSDITGVATGFVDLDRQTSGLQKGDLVIVAGRPSMGKTSFAVNIGENVALNEGLPVLIFSMEMAGAQLATRMLGSVGRVDQSRLRTGKLNDDEWPRVTEAIAKLSQAPILIDETGALNSLELRARARRMARKWGQVGLIIIDYLQLMTGNSTGTGENRTSEISEISRSLKALAKEMQCPVIALSQLNRGLEQRPNKRPVMSDLRECVVGDTLVCLADGRRVPIKELVGQTPLVLAMDESQKIISAQSDMVWSVGVKPIVKLTTASGRVLRATEGHRIYTGNGWKTIGESAIGDRLALSRNMPVEATKRWDESHLILLAHLIGDGSYVTHQPMRYTTASEANSNAVRLAAESFGSTVRRVEGPAGTWHQLVIAGNGNRWHPKAVGAWLKNLGIYGQRSKDKYIPKDIFELQNDQIALFLKHLWATDGSIYFKKTNKKTATRIYFASCSEQLVRDVQALLLRLGIGSRLRNIIQKNKNPLWNVDISGASDQLKFLQLVGAFGEKLENAEALRDHLVQVQANTNVDTLPIKVFEEVKETMLAQGVTQRAMAQMRGTAYGGSSHFSFAPSREVLGNYARLLNSANLSKWAESDLFWDRIVAIESDGQEEVFDLTVPGPASWLADGLVSHNSGAIEQDADVILFIYRDEVYHADTTTEKGIAEVIVGKQRNGPIGTIKLSWQGQFTKFDNLALGAIPPPFGGGSGVSAGGYGGGYGGSGGDGGNFSPF